MFLLETLDIKISAVIPELYSKEVVSAVEREDIYAEKTSFRANEKLLSVLSRKSPQQFQLFLDTLNDCGQQYIRDILTKDQVELNAIWIIFSLHWKLAWRDICFALSSSAHLLTGVYILLALISFFLIFFNDRLKCNYLSIYTGPIFAIFIPYENVLGADENFVNFGPVTLELTGLRPIVNFRYDTAKFAYPAEYLRIYWTDFHIFFTKWKQFSSKWSI